MIIKQDLKFFPSGYFNIKGVFALAVPARRTSKAKKGMRRGHIKLANPGLSACPNCGELRKPHIVCPSCGYYDGKQVVNENN